MIRQGYRKFTDASGTLYLCECEFGQSLDGTWYARPPSGHVSSLADYSVTEHEDGTISVSAAIRAEYAASHWLGYLIKGVWDWEDERA